MAQVCPAVQAYQPARQRRTNELDFLQCGFVSLYIEPVDVSVQLDTYIRIWDRPESRVSVAGSLGYDCAPAPVLLSLYWFVERSNRAAPRRMLLG